MLTRKITFIMLQSLNSKDINTKLCNSSWKMPDKMSSKLICVGFKHFEMLLNYNNHFSFLTLLKDQNLEVTMITVLEVRGHLLKMKSFLWQK